MSVPPEGDERRPLLSNGSEDDTSVGKSTYSSVNVVPAEESPSTSSDPNDDLEAAKERDGNSRMAKLVRF